jgi:hypothetical protein
LRLTPEVFSNRLFARPLEGEQRCLYLPPYQRTCAQRPAPTRSISREQG